MTTQFPEIFANPGELRELMKNFGRIVIEDHNFPVLHKGQHEMITGILLTLPSHKQELEFISLNRGSLEGFFEDVFDKVGKVFRDLLQNSNSIVKGGEGLALKNSLRGICVDSGKDKDTQLVAAGVVMLGAEKLRRSLTALGATKLEVH